MMEQAGKIVERWSRSKERSYKGWVAPRGALLQGEFFLEDRVDLANDEADGQRHPAEAGSQSHAD